MQPFCTVASLSAIQIEIALGEWKDQLGTSICHEVGLPQAGFCKVWSCQTRMPLMSASWQSILPSVGLRKKFLISSLTRQRLTRCRNTRL